MISIL